ncbi:stage II sporulation protein D [Desulfallas thermosapovorans DSM 6562]|uniref:Stage II sporulation protein D n=1 Tax=Desulfallas thermosapovorans DSM 6562 TaxID=1121431 RepID=A0A5S4ZW40_9FIRM|nr:SpoIID/LytB domain-containing protein [Desulfallas thermosapovorans]TYO96959.1 stage II sporulation protein D [Desulfallas thermosapovorans DSM 6562]
MRLIKIALVALVIAGLIWGCARAPQRKPDEPVPGAPKEEPTISLYIKERDIKKNIKLEEYLAGVVAAEMEPTWPENALAAQAILARTFTMENIQAGRVRKLHGTDASTDIEEFQAYDPSRINDKVLRAVASTRGQVITYRGDYVKGWFSACDGGISATAEEGLAYTKEPTPYIKAGARDGCLEVTVPENRHWSVTIPLEQVRAAVREISGQDPGNINTVEIVERGPSGRATRIQVGSATVGGPDLRLALGSDKVRSTLISSARIEGYNLVLEGKGFGHGVGLCQWGANKMASEGKSPQEIIKFYYQDVDIQKLWD